jgi:SAM-dependent methyltransferase
MALKDHQDAFGHGMYDHFMGVGSDEIIERDDGFFSISPGSKLYFAPFEEWPQIDQDAMKFVQGRVLDIGCGAGRHALYLQEKGFDVTGIDNSPQAIKVCKLRGLRNAQILPITKISARLGLIDTILMLGNNFALTGNPRRARWLLRKFHKITSENGRILAQTRDPYQTDLPEHLEYHRRNREIGKLSGEARLRVRYKKYVTPWIDFLMVSKEEIATILEGTNWMISGFIDWQGGVYTAILEKK